MTLSGRAISHRQLGLAAAEPAADLGQRQAQEHGAAVRRGQRQVDAVERAQQSLGLARGQTIAGAHHRVTGDRAEQRVEPLGFAGRAGLGPLVEHAAQELRRIAGWEHTKVIMISSKDYMQDRAIAKKLGAVDFVAKPMNTQAIRDLIILHTGARQKQSKPVKKDG